jgi:hypothetical protein
MLKDSSSLLPVSGPPATSSWDHRHWMTDHLQQYGTFGIQDQVVRLILRPLPSSGAWQSELQPKS